MLKTEFMIRYFAGSFSNTPSFCSQPNVRWKIISDHQAHLINPTEKEIISREPIWYQLAIELISRTRQRNIKFLLEITDISNTTNTLIIYRKLGFINSCTVIFIPRTIKHLKTSSQRFVKPMEQIFLLHVRVCHFLAFP